MMVEHLQVDLDGTVSKEELGRSTWTFLHTVAAQVHLISSLCLLSPKSVCVISIILRYPSNSAIPGVIL